MTEGCPVAGWPALSLQAWGDLPRADYGMFIAIITCASSRSPATISLEGRRNGGLIAKLQLKWSPEQIAGWLRRTYPRTPLRQVLHETIYRSRYVQH
jgi:hypothetical protein